MDIFAVIAQTQGAKLVNPGKSPFTGKTFIVDGFIKQALTSAFSTLLVTFVLIHIGNETMIETNFTCSAGIERTIRIKKCTSNLNTLRLDAFESTLQIDFQIKGIMSVASHNAGAGKNEAMGITDRQDMTGFGTFAILRDNALTPFLGNAMRAIQVQVRASSA